MRREARRVVVLAVVVVLLAVLGYAWSRHLLTRPSPEERAREKATELQEKARRLTR